MNLSVENYRLREMCKRYLSWLDISDVEKGLESDLQDPGMWAKPFKATRHRAKACPFCGEKPVVTKEGIWNRVSCVSDKCKVNPVVNWNESQAKVIARWNNRA